MYSSDFLNAKQSNKSIKLINIENAKDSAGKARGEILFSPNTNNDGLGLSEMNDGYGRNRGGPPYTNNQDKNFYDLGRRVKPMHEGAADQDGDSQFTHDQEEVSDAYIQKIASINDGLKAELTAVAEQMESQLLRIQEKKRLKAARE